MSINRRNIFLRRMAGVAAALSLPALAWLMPEAKAAPPFEIPGEVVEAVDTIALAEEVEMNPDSVDAALCFLNMPADVLEILPADTRFKMIAFWHADSVYHAPNAMEGTSYLRSVTPDFLDVQITDVSRMQLRLLPTRNKDKKMVMTVYTVGSDRQSPDSEIRFFDIRMNELPRERFFKEPKIADFFSIPKGGVVSMKEIEQKIPFPTVEYSASAADNNLTGRLTVGIFMNEDAYKEVKPFEKDSIVYDWDGKRFRLRK